MWQEKINSGFSRKSHWRKMHINRPTKTTVSKVSTMMSSSCRHYTLHQGTVFTIANLGSTKFLKINDQAKIFFNNSPEAFAVSGDPQCI